MAGGKQNTQRGRRAPSQRGDFTGNKDAQLREEQAEVLEQRRGELGLIKEQNAAIKDEGVIDMMDPDKATLDHPDLDEGEEVLINAAAREPSVDTTAPTSAEGTVLNSSTGRGSYEVAELPAEQPQAALQSDEVLTKELLERPVIVRMEYDLEDITIGQGNTYTFRAGYRYRLPRWVAAHLEEKMLCTILDLNPAA